MWVYSISAIIFLWLVVLSYFLFRTRKHYKDLTNKTGKGNIEEILNVLTAESEKFARDTGDIKKELSKLEGESAFYFKKIGIVRFNAFGRAGNDQSFALSLLDEKDNGVILNFIYAPQGLRVYLKKVKEGKGEGYQLSEEEEKAVKEST